MGVASGDYDGDGDEDLFVTNIAGETFALYQNDGRGNFDDVRVRAGVGRPTAAFTGFGTEWIDYDNDGWLDLIAVNGAVNMVERLRGQPNPFRMRSLLFHNDGDGRLRDVTRGGRAGHPARSGQSRRRGRRHRQRRRPRPRRDGERRPGAIAAGPGAARAITGCGFASSSRRAIGWRWARASASSALVDRRCGVASAPTAAISRRATRASTSASVPSATIDGVVVTWPDGVRERFTSVGVDRTVTLRRGAGRPVP